MQYLLTRILVFLGSLQKSCFRKAALFLAFMYTPKNGTPGADRARITLIYFRGEPFLLVFYQKEQSNARNTGVSGHSDPDIGGVGTGARARFGSHGE